MKRTPFTFLFLFTLVLGGVYHVIANACSRIVAITPRHGVVVSRTLDWSETLGEIAEVSVVGQHRTTRNRSGRYKQAASWKVKYQTLSFVEPLVFDDTTSEAINTVGLSASLLYMGESEKFQKTHRDSGAPAVNLNNIAGFLVENYSTVQEALDAHQAGKWQCAWAECIHAEGGKIHGLHFAVQDKTGHIALFQFTEAGEVIYDNRKGDEDIKVMTNDPLLWKQRVMQEYVGKNNIRRMDADIHPYSRHQRLTAYLEAQKFKPEYSRANVDAMVTLVMDAGGSVPYDLIDEATQKCYQTQMKIQYHFETGDISFKSYHVDEQMRFNLSEITRFKDPMYADLMGDLAAGYKSPQWKMENPAK